MTEDEIANATKNLIAGGDLAYQFLLDILSAPDLQPKHRSLAIDLLKKMGPNLKNAQRRVDDQKLEELRTRKQKE